MVKDGPFLNADSDYPVKCSQLVNKKKSSSIVEDVSYSCLAKSSSPKEARVLELNKVVEHKPIPIQSQSIEIDNTNQAIDEEMLDYASSPKDDIKVTPTPRTSVKRKPYEDQLSPANPSLWDSSVFHSPRSQQDRIGSIQKSKFDTHFRNPLSSDIQVESRASTLHLMPKTVEKANFMLAPSDFVVQNSVAKQPIIEQFGEEQVGVNKEEMTEEVSTVNYDDEVSEAKLKLILRSVSFCLTFLCNMECFSLTKCLLRTFPLPGFGCAFL